MSGSFSRQSLNRRYRHFSHDLASALSILCRSKTVSDFGAGIGLYVEYLRATGCWAVGYDGTPGIDEITGGAVQFADLSLPVMLPITNAVISIEVGEHIPPKFESVFLDNLCRHATELLIVSWATVNQPGRGHCNCQNFATLAPKFAERGWIVDWSMTRPARIMSGDPWDSKLLVMKPSRGV